MPLKKLHGGTLGEQIAFELRLRIVSGASVPGTKISENQIANEFETSRSPVRDALKMLASEGLIRLERMGAVVIGLDEKDLEELYEVRYLIESFALRRLAKRKDSQVVVTLEKITDKMEVAAKHKDYVEFSHLDFLFHETIIKGMNQNRMTHLWYSIKYVVLAVLLITTEKRFEKKIDECTFIIETHKKITSSIIQQDTEYMEQVLQEHFSDASNSIDNLL